MCLINLLLHKRIVYAYSNVCELAMHLQFVDSCNTVYLINLDFLNLNKVVQTLSAV